MSALEKAILKTIMYFDIFSYPLTLLEVQKWLWQEQEGDLLKIKEILDRHSLIQEKNGLYFLKTSEKNIDLRMQRYNIAEHKFKKRWLYFKFIAMMPGVRAIFVCNTLSYSNSRAESDIDLAIIAAPHKIWTARFFTTVFTALLHIRPTVKKTQNQICLSFYLEENNLNLEKIKIHNGQDIHFTYWLDQFFPVYLEDDILEKFIKNNEWLKKDLPNSIGSYATYQRQIKTGVIFRIIKKFLSIFSFEKIYKKIQLKILPQHFKDIAKNSTNVVLSDHLLKFHDHDRREYYQNIWLDNCAKVQ
jgi:hypothetical protein